MQAGLWGESSRGSCAGWAPFVAVVSHPQRANMSGWIGLFLAYNKKEPHSNAACFPMLCCTLLHRSAFFVTFEAQQSIVNKSCLHARAFRLLRLEGRRLPSLSPPAKKWATGRLGPPHMCCGVSSSNRRSQVRRYCDQLPRTLEPT